MYILEGLFCLSGVERKFYESFLLSLCPNIDIIPDEKIWYYYIFLFGGIEFVGTVEHGESVTCGKECDHV